MKNSVSISALLGCCLAFSVSCGQKKENRALAYFQNAEIQYSEESEKQNLIAGLEDALTLSAEDLAARRYPDYSGNENQWGLRTLVERHFVPDEQGKTLGDDFFEAVKTPEVQEMMREIKKALETSEEADRMAAGCPIQQGQVPDSTGSETLTRADGFPDLRR